MDSVASQSRLLAAHTDSGPTPSQTDPSEGVPGAQTTYGVDGTGVTIGIISDSFNLTDPVTAQAPNGDNMAFDIADGDLPANVHILMDGPAGEGEMDEGRAIGQLVHDIAPNAAIDFYAAGDQQQDMADGILALAKAGCKVIVDDIIFPDEPAYQDGVIAQAIDEVVRDYGVTYLSSAGNQNGEGWQGAARFTPSTTLYASTGRVFVDPNTHTSTGIHLQDFSGTGEDYLPLTALFTPQYAKDGIPTDVEVALEWNQPQAGGVSSGPTSQLELLLQDGNGQYLLPAAVQGTESISASGEAVQIVDFQPVSGQAYRILVADVSTNAAPTDLKIVVYSDDSVVLGDTATSAAAETTATDYGHATAAGAIAVGAVDYLDTPVNGVSPPVAEDFSSLGPDLQYFAANGSPLATPTYAHGPDITAADGGDTSFFPEYPDSDYDGNGNQDGLPNFFGTSAAVGDAGAIAALVLQADPALAPSQVEALLELTALPMANAAQSGAGLVQAEGAVGVAEELTQTQLSPVFGSNTGGVVQGTASGQILLGGAAADTLVAGPGTERMDGGGGIDTASFAGFAHDYALALNGGAGTVIGGREGAQDTLTSVENVSFQDGVLTFDPNSTAAEIVRLYDSFLGRAPDAAGFDNYLNYLASGHTLADAANVAAASPEFADATAGLTDTQYVTYVYEHSLHREPDPTGLATYVADLENGTFTRTSMIVQAAESPEHVALEAGVVAAGLWVPNETVEGLELLYDASVQRQPDPTGIAGYGALVAQGVSFKDIANQMSNSAEFLAAHANQTDAQYIDSLYVAEVGRHADPAGLAAYEQQLQSGYTRGDILYETAFSQEHQSHVLAYYDPLLGAS